MSSNFKIEYINENDYNRIFVVSDIHGYYNLFEKLLNKINFKKDYNNHEYLILQKFYYNHFHLYIQF